MVYTPWANLKKTATMEVGQVGFHNPKLVGSLLALPRKTTAGMAVISGLLHHGPDMAVDDHHVVKAGLNPVHFVASVSSQ